MLVRESGHEILAGPPREIDEVEDRASGGEKDTSPRHAYGVPPLSSFRCASLERGKDRVLGASVGGARWW